MDALTSIHRKQLKTFAEKAHRLLSQVYIKDANDKNPWESILFGLTGCMYSLNKASEFLGAERNQAKLKEETTQILEALQGSLSFDEAKTPGWSAGYHLNNAELRLASTYHRLLKTFVDIEGNKNNVGELREKLLKSCPVCGGESRVCYPKSNKLLSEWKTIQNSFNNNQIDVFDYSDLSCAASIERIGVRVNSLKHQAKRGKKMFIPDAEKPGKRFHDACIALEGFLMLFEDFAGHKGYLPH